jgi:hypothetical protein
VWKKFLSVIYAHAFAPKKYIWALKKQEICVRRERISKFLINSQNCSTVAAVSRVFNFPHNFSFSLFNKISSFALVRTQKSINNIFRSLLHLLSAHTELFRQQIYMKVMSPQNVISFPHHHHTRVAWKRKWKTVTNVFCHFPTCVCVRVCVSI